MPLAKLSSKAQIVIPAPIRRQLNIKPGDELEISAAENIITIRKSQRLAADALDACGSDIWQDYEKELDEAREQWTT